jgi:hypothetical protein
VPEQHLKDDLVLAMAATVEQQTGTELRRHETSMPVKAGQPRGAQDS